ncbi:MAG: hypothetical protein Ct9H300mP12_04180 [Acidimicrobiales bacterium]|nr:MAG: hypothetical protein Ct9H300mP12_04180 [Acidimicrobiales bacterium]
MIHGYSGSNPRIRGLRRLARDRGQRYEKRSFIVEGPVLVAEALDAGLDVRLVVGPESPLDDLKPDRRSTRCYGGHRPPVPTSARCPTRCLTG